MAVVSQPPGAGAAAGRDAALIGRAVAKHVESHAERSAAPSAVPRRLRLCFVAPNGFGALTGNATEHTGGIERQTSLWARWFAGRGHDVQIVTWDVGQRDGERIAGVTARKLCRSDAGLPGLRYFHPRWTSLVAALNAADADVYVYMNGDSKLGQMALWCGRRRKPLAYYVSSNRSIDPSLPGIVAREKPLYRFGLRRADCILVQTAWQQRRLLEFCGRSSIVVGMPCDEVATEAATAAKRVEPGNPMVLWVGRISPEKRFEWLLELAAGCPDVRFEVAGAPNKASGYAEALWRRAATLPNLTLHGRVAEPAAMAGLYRRAALLCCTSSSEGFPNTFLEAWSHGVPVVTTFDPDGLVAERGLGAVATDVPGLAAAMRNLLASPEAYERCSRNARSHYRRHHRPDHVLGHVERLFGELVSRCWAVN